MEHLATARRSTASLLLVTYLLGCTGCSSWQTQSGSAQAILAARPAPQRPDTTVTTSPDGSRTMAVNDQGSDRIRIATTAQPMMTVVSGPRIANDSLYGVMAGSKTETALPLNEIIAVQVRKGSRGKTVALVGGIVLGVGLAGAAIGTMVAMSQECVVFCGGTDY